MSASCTTATALLLNKKIKNSTAKNIIKKLLVSAVWSGACGERVRERADSVPRPRIVPAQFTTATAQFTTATAQFTTAAAILLNFLVSGVCFKVPVEVERADRLVLLQLCCSSVAERERIGSTSTRGTERIGERAERLVLLQLCCSSVAALLQRESG